MAQDNNKLIASIDIGTKHTRILVGEQEPNGAVHIEGYGKSLSRGVIGGRVVDINKVSESISEAMNQVNKRFNRKLLLIHFISSVSDLHMTIHNSKGRTPIKDQKITAKDIESALFSAAIPNPTNKQIIDTFVTSYFISGQDINQFELVPSPLGMEASGLEIITHNISISNSAINNIASAVRLANKAEVIDYYIESMASAAAILTQSEKNRGAIVIDIGSNITSFSIYVDGSIFHNGILDFGGDNINEIIAQSFAIDVMSAEYLKINYGKLEANISEKDKLISLEIKIQGKIVIKYLSSMDLYEALGDAYDSLLEKIKKEIFSIKNFKFQKIKSGIYLTGGGSNISGIEAKTRRLLNINVKKGSVNRDFINGEEKILADPEYSASLGLFNLWLQKQQVSTEESVTQKSDIGSKIGAWLKNF